MIFDGIVAHPPPLKKINKEIKNAGISLLKSYGTSSTYITL